MPQGVVGGKAWAGRSDPWEAGSSSSMNRSHPGAIPHLPQLLPHEGHLCSQELPAGSASHPGPGICSFPTCSSPLLTPIV